jgi:hypothetical protein
MKTPSPQSSSSAGDRMAQQTMHRLGITREPSPLRDFPESKLPDFPQSPPLQPVIPDPPHHHGS